MQIKTNNVPRDILRWDDLSADERSEFDYFEGDERWDAEFFRYRERVYDLGEFTVWDNPASPTRGQWDGFRSDSFFSGLVVRYVDDFERVVVGLALS